MKPNRVPDDLLKAAGDAVRAWYLARPNPNSHLDDRTQMRLVIAAALTLHDERAEQRHRVALEPGETLPTIESLRAEVRAIVDAGTAPQQPEHAAAELQCGSHAYTNGFPDPMICCELPDGHVWHRNGERTWTP